MDAREVRQLVLQEIDDRWDESNSHAFNLRTALIKPTPTPMIHRLVRNGKIKDAIVDVWIVLKELPEGDGYLIFYDEDRNQFGLASKGFPEDRYPVISGYYGSFWNAFKGM
ncbi:hypothetical protein LOC68_08830 [Blastopirellula sp. JC732]|uniref:Uncharacterized protein n=1 Tax=Blastopirellula sediminis TaxID=2894196 RepID=A0A9X1SFN0_9BACT|nr:hypothetical protein [Blastopirellula sediminis]MCC9608725.1 hypothetical protein [Blastopirellula sediminis]MCC9628498.1 hypothetical protein [Blastopirellula sediminis]